jgi:hypothetical protein
VPDGLATGGRGCGGRTPARPRAARTLQGRIEGRPGRLAACPLQDGRLPAQRAAFPPGLPAGALRRAARGYWDLEALQTLERHGGLGRARLQTPTAIYAPTGPRQPRLALLAAPPTAAVEHAVLLGAEPRGPARLFAVRGPPDVAEARRRRRREAAQKKGRPVSGPRLARAAGPLLVMKGPSDRVPRAAALGLGRSRWQIARRFTWWKRPGRVAASRSPTPGRMLCEVSAPLWALLGQQGVFLGSCWPDPDRRLTKAAQPVQKHALHLASALARGQRRGDALRTIQPCLTAGCRMHPRKKHPNPSQLLLNATST